MVVTNILVECLTGLYIEDRLIVLPENIRLRLKWPVVTQAQVEFRTGLHNKCRVLALPTNIRSR